MVWSPSYTLLLDTCKSKRFFPPLLFHCDRSTSVFLKTVWSVSGMGYILMQPDNTSESFTALKYLAETEEYGYK